MAKIKLIINNKEFINSIPVKKATKFLKGIDNLYNQLALNKKEELKRNLEEFKLEINDLHFSKATFILNTPIDQQSILPEKDIYAEPIKDMAILFDLSKKNNNQIKETYSELIKIIPERELRKDIIESTLALCPTKIDETIDIKYRSQSHTNESIKIEGIHYKLRDHIRGWKTQFENELTSMKELSGVVMGIITTTEEPYIFISSKGKKLVKCYYSEKSFSKELQISDLRVTEDIITLKGKYIIMEGNTPDKLEEISDIKKTFSEASLEEFLENEPDLYKDKTLKEKTIKTVIKMFENLKKTYESEIKKLLILKDGWDLPNSKGYKIRTIVLGLLYLSKIKVLLKETYGKDLPRPMLFPGGSGGIEFEWAEKIDFQISIPFDTTQLIGIYGYIKEDNKELLIDCRLFEVNEELLKWLDLIL